MKATGQTALLALAVIWIVGCGSLKSGTWEDDSDNYRRASGMSPPAELVIRHSWYRRLPHFTREEIYFFEFEADAEWVRALVEANEMVEVDPRGREEDGVWLPEFRLRRHLCMDPPAWFAPEEPTTYRIWTGDRSFPSSPELVLFDGSTRTTFVAACLL